jgi:hypothetical protein
MTRKDFQLVADVIAQLPSKFDRTVLSVRFAEALANTNDRFDRERFIDACKAEQE